MLSNRSSADADLIHKFQLFFIRSLRLHPGCRDNRNLCLYGTCLALDWSELLTQATCYCSNALHVVLVKCLRDGRLNAQIKHKSKKSTL